MINKIFCSSSYLAYRYIEKEDVEFGEGLHHENFVPLSDEERIAVTTYADIDRVIEENFNRFKDEKLGIMLSGGMDSAILAAYMPGTDAYTFRFLGGDFQQEELKRAEYYAKTYGLRLHYVDIEWKDVEEFLPIVMKGKGAPVHSIEPQIYKAAKIAKEDGITMMIVGESSDLIFGGMDQLLAKDWTYEEFKKRYTFLEPQDVLCEYEDVSYLFERYRVGDKIDFLKFMDEVFSIESSSSYLNAFACAGMRYFDPYANMKMAEPLDLARVRNGESKYLIRELFKKKYPDFPVPEKVPMPRPVDAYFAEWEGPKRPEFKKDLVMENFTGNQKWQMYCLERFLEQNNM